MAYDVAIYKAAMAAIAVLIIGSGLGLSRSSGEAAAASSRDWRAVDAAVEASSIPSMALIVGEETGTLHTYVKGGFSLRRHIKSHPGASC